MVLTLSSCAFAPVNYGKVDQGQWRAKALIKDLDQSRSYIVNIDFNAIRDKNLRMDVKTTLGTGVAALTADQKDVRYLLVNAKKFYYGASRPEVMRPVLAIPFDPRGINNLLFDIPFRDRSWTCTKDQYGFVKKCTDLANGIKVSWSQRTGVRKTIFIEHRRGTVQLNILSFKPKVEDRKDLFELKVPPSFEELNIY